MTAIALALVAIGLLQLDGRRISPVNIAAAFALLTAAAVAFADQGWLG